EPAARALEFTILTAARSGEALGAQWPEIDFDQKIWMVPPERMKTGKEHTVPLCAPALDILRRLHGDRLGDAIFPFSKNIMTKLLARMGRGDLTVHGFRATFSTWAAEHSAFAREVVEAALAHAVGDRTERAYKRGDALEKRRRLMDAWAAF